MTPTERRRADDERQVRTMTPMQSRAADVLRAAGWQAQQIGAVLGVPVAALPKPPTTRAPDPVGLVESAALATEEQP